MKNNSKWLGLKKTKMECWRLAEKFRWLIYFSSAILPACIVSEYNILTSSAPLFPNYSPLFWNN